MPKATVYFTKTITPDSLQRIYQALGVELTGKIGVKISTGEPGGHNYLHPALIGPLVRQLDGIIIECCTAYAGRRMDPKEHWQAIREHGFQDMAPCDLLDEFGELTLSVRDGFHLKENIVGDHFRRYDSILVLSHFKGHAMGSRISASAWPPPGARPASTPPASPIRRPSCSTTCPRRTIFSSPWPTPAARSSTTRGRSTCSTSTWPTA